MRCRLHGVVFVSGRDAHEDVASRGERRRGACKSSSLSLRPGGILIHVDNRERDKQEDEVDLYQEEKRLNQELVAVSEPISLHRWPLGCYAQLLIL